MLSLSSKKHSSTVGLDVEAESIAATEVRRNGGASVRRTAVTPLAPGVIAEGELRDPDALAAALRGMFAEHKLPKQVRLGVANQRIAVRTLRLPALEDPKELDAAVRFQAQDQIPMPLDGAVLDHRVIGRGIGEDGARSVDVVAVAARRDMLEPFARALRSAGLRPMGIDLSAFGMIRALADAGSVEENGAAGEPGEALPAILCCSLGDISNLAVARGRSCLFTRASTVGIGEIAQRLAERRGLTLVHARQWLSHVGLERPSESIEGDPQLVAAAREALDEGVARLADELRLSLDFYAAQEGASAVERAVLCGPGSTIPGLVARVGAALGLPVEATRPAPLAALGDRNAARLTVSYGLALER
jgi:type IV pilus assembly protein PilM